MHTYETVSWRTSYLNYGGARWLQGTNRLSTQSTETTTWTNNELQKQKTREKCKEKIKTQNENRERYICGVCAKIEKL